ncbi:hypothetical protein LIA77_11353 [Sarocladium implicatum]|nr:hypothetical protein LIA77_11353 [Sarocladium implicatum]
MATTPNGHAYYTETSPGNKLQFKRHKTLPRPHADLSPHKTRLPRVRTLDLHVDARRPSSSGSQPSSPRTLKHMTKRIGSGPDFPPTPPTHSRTSSSTLSALPPSPTGVDESQAQTPTGTVHRTLSTPPDQRSPPTPDVTPPQPKSRPRALRPTLAERGASRSTTADSRTESFKTAREDPFSSEDEEIFPATKQLNGLISGKSSQATVRRSSESRTRTRPPQPLALSTALASLGIGGDEFYTPRTVGEFGRFDGNWDSPNGVDTAADEASKKLAVPKRTAVPDMEVKQAFAVDDEAVTPTEATRAVRKTPIRDDTSMISPPKTSSDRATISSGPSHSGTSISNGARNSSTRSPRSTTSTIVEAVLIEAPAPVQRQRTLRHVRKQNTLRGPITRAEPVSRASRAVQHMQQTLPAEKSKFAELARPDRSRHESYASNSTSTSIASGRARREIWKSGGVPVVIIPDRRSSSQSRSARTPSLRSMSSNPSKRAMSIASTPHEESDVKTKGPVFERQSRRSRAQSLSGDSERTMDFPPTIPARSSSLSAPTSRNSSRAGSLTAESLRAHNAILRMNHSPEDSTKREAAVGPSRSQRRSTSGPPPSTSPEVDRGTRSLVPSEAEKNERRDTLDTEHHDDARSSRRTHPRNTPFSVASFATTGTAPELAEAMEVHMYPHQNSSVVVVDHSGRPSEETAEITAVEARSEAKPTKPKPKTTASDHTVPVTPPQPVFSLEDVDSPLRNPRAPPEPPSHPPTFNIIPATPSGNTPATEKAVQMNNYFEGTSDKPQRRPSLVRRALSNRRHSVSYPPSASKPAGFITRTLSLSRGSRQVEKTPAPNMESEPRHRDDEKPVEENKLHPLWRPSWDEGDDECDSDCDCRRESHSEDRRERGKYFRYPLVDNRPSKPKRTFSEKMRRTFAILPLENDLYYDDAVHGPERRTIRRTPSGNLRVVRQRNSMESLSQPQDDSTRPATAPDTQARRSFWRGNSVRRRASKEQLRRRSSLGSRLEDIQSLPRRLSEKRRERRSEELRTKISGPTEVRDGVGDMIRVGHGRSRQEIVA